MTWAQRYPAAGLVPYDPAWPARYAALAGALGAALGPSWVLEHVGSTSVPGLAAKPVVDVAARLPEGLAVGDASAAFVRAGWSGLVEVGDHWAAFHPPDGVRAAIAHVFTAAQWPEAHVRLFADRLRRDAAERKAYEDLKRGLVATGVWDSGYTRGKADLVRDVVNRERADRGLPPVEGPL